MSGVAGQSQNVNAHGVSPALSHVRGTFDTKVMQMLTDLRGTVALQDLEQNSCAKAKGEAYHQTGHKNVQKLGKDGEHCCAVQLNVTPQSLQAHSA